MSNLLKQKEWRELSKLSKKMKKAHMRDLFKKDKKRAQKYSIRFNEFILDYSKNLIDKKTFKALISLALYSDLKRSVNKMFTGDKLNFTENRAVLHTALRNMSDNSIYVDGKNVMPKIKETREKMKEFSEKVRNGEWKGYNNDRIVNVVNIGIGGSDLGPSMVCEALKPYTNRDMNFYFVSNVDGTHISEVLRRIEPGNTLFIISSKTFTTQETMENAQAAKKWFIERTQYKNAVSKHFVAVSTNKTEVEKFGIARENIFEFWDWVGGRYSLWSAIGLSITIAVGSEKFEEMLEGAYEMDEHFRTEPFESNMPVVMALLGIWHNNFFHAESHAILPYDQYLSRFPAYLQQVDMESNGKRVNINGEEVKYSTGPIIWGEPGTNGQHAFYQLIHQGTKFIPSDFILPVESHNPIGNQHKILAANCLAQAEAFMKGKTKKEAKSELIKSGVKGKMLKTLLPHKIFPGNKPSNMILIKKITPRNLGSLIAMYEHKIFTQGVIWKINSFDQWGVELGKQLAKKILPELESNAKIGEHDSSTKELIKTFNKGL